MSQPYMQLYVADYLGDTQHLSTEEHGAYLLLLMTMWRHEGKLPNDPAKLARIARVHPPRWPKVAAAVMAFFDATEDGFITQKRLLKEHEKASHKARSRASAGAAGGRANALKNNKQRVAKATVLPQHLPEPDIIKKEEDAYASLSDSGASDALPRKGGRGGYPPEFEALWSSYPTDRNMSKKAAWTVWRRFGKGKQAEALASCVPFRAYCAANPDYRPVHLARYLSQERFSGFNEVPRGPPVAKPLTPEERSALGRQIAAELQAERQANGRNQDEVRPVLDRRAGPHEGRSGDTVGEERGQDGSGELPDHLAGNGRVGGVGGLFPQPLRLMSGGYGRR